MESSWIDTPDLISHRVRRVKEGLGRKNEDKEEKEWVVYKVECKGCDKHTLERQSSG